MLLHDLGPVRQFGYVVRDIDAAMQHWTKILGVGPFFYFEEAPVQDLRYRGHATDARVRVAFSNSGPIQIELVQPLDEHPSLFNDFVQRGLEGQQHMAFWTRELDFWVERCADNGIEVLMSGYTGAPDGRFVYVSTETHPGTIIELSEVQGRKAEFFAEVARACETWKGERPIRSLNI